jgi:hypothetical protein
MKPGIRRRARGSPIKWRRATARYWTTMERHKLYITTVRVSSFTSKAMRSAISNPFSISGCRNQSDEVNTRMSAVHEPAPGPPPPCKAASSKRPDPHVVFISQSRFGPFGVGVDP